jgi:hypothetical protein
MDVLNLWESFSRRISTIYLPDKKRPMLPTILSDCLCSLQQNAPRFSFVMDIIIDSEYKIESISYSNCLIRVCKNYAYEEESLLLNSEYKLLMSVTKKLSYNYKYLSNIRNSHDVVCYLMIFMNYHCAQDLLKHKNGIFRSTIINKTVHLPDNINIPEEVHKFIKVWNSSCGQYIDIEAIAKENTEIITILKKMHKPAFIQFIYRRCLNKKYFIKKEFTNKNKLNFDC